LTGAIVSITLFKKKYTLTVSCDFQTSENSATANKSDQLCIEGHVA